MSSIRTKLFFNIGLLLVFFLLAAWGLSALFLESYYIDNKQHLVIDSAQTIADLYSKGADDISLEMERLAGSNGGAMVIFDKTGYVKYTSFDRLANQVPGRRQLPPGGADKATPPPPGPPRHVVVTATRVVDSATVIETENDPTLNISFMVLKRQLADGDVLLIRLPLAAVAESATYASRFMAFSGLVAMLAGGIWAYFFARRFTAPLKELSAAAHNISRLDFSQKCAISGEDELAQLGESINNLSTQLNKAIAELNERNRQLAADVEKERSLDKLRKNFISSVSHELKTPVSLILGYAEGLKENVADDADSRNYYCSVIIDEAAKMDKLIKDLLDLSQVESGFFRMQRTDFDLSPLIDDLLLKYRARLADKGISLVVEKAPPILVSGDELRVEQAIINLLNNAIDHADNEKLIRLTVAEGPDKIRLSLFNTGKQIAADCLDNLWLSFYKTDQARTREFGGYGLGLSIVRAIQELHGNAYGVENVAGGVVFWFELDKVK
jgi:two-component system sensor histidine kinase VanS